MPIIRIRKGYRMNTGDVAIIGKQVRDMYGTPMGRAIGTMTNIDGSIQTVGIDCASQGLQQVPLKQLVAQGDVVIYIPEWRLESQRLLREKGLTLRRLRALMDIVSENDDMKEDATLIHDKYKSQLLSFAEVEREINSRLEARLAELDEQLKSVKMLIFDAKVQFKSNEMSESVFESVQKHTTDLIERITHENAEISNVQRRMVDLNMEVQQALEEPSQHLQDSAVSYLDVGSSTTPAPAMPSIPEPPTEEIPSPPPQAAHAPIPEPPSQDADSGESDKSSDQSDWLARMEAQ